MKRLGPHTRMWLEKVAIATLLLALSALLYSLAFWFLGDWQEIKHHFLLKLAFLPIHALVLTIIIEEILALREKMGQRKKLNLFLGTFFRQMGTSFYVAMVQLVENREALEQVIIVDPAWRGADFRRARQQLGSLRLDMRSDPECLRKVWAVLLEKEDAILTMTRNPNLWDYEHLYRCLLALFHIIEEAHLRGEVDHLSPAALRHLSGEVGRSLALLLRLWLEYMEFLKSEHPLLFGFRVGVHSMVQPLEMGPEWRD